MFKIICVKFCFPVCRKKEQSLAVLILDANRCAYMYVHGCVFVYVYTLPRSWHLLYFHNSFLYKPKHATATKLNREQGIVVALTSRERVIKRKIREEIQNLCLLGEGVSTFGNPARA